MIESPLKSLDKKLLRGDSFFAFEKLSFCGDYLAMPKKCATFDKIFCALCTYADSLCRLLVIIVPYASVIRRIKSRIEVRLDKVRFSYVR